jgi:hypothetical protein
MGTRTTELAIGLGLFVLGLLGLATGVLAVPRDSTAGVSEPVATLRPTGGIVLADANGDEAPIDSDRPDSSVPNGPSGAGPGGPTASLEPIGPPQPPGMPVVTSATLDVDARWDEGDAEKDGHDDGDHGEGKDGHDDRDHHEGEHDKDKGDRKH